MNIIYISTVFPKESESSTIYTDLAEELVSRGHNITVVAAEEKKKSLGTRVVKERGCTVLRVRIGNIYDVGIVEKGVSILTLERKLKAAIKKHLCNDNYDLVLFEAPPVTLSGVVKNLKKLYSAPAFLMMKDIFPQNAIDIGMIKKGSLIHKFFLRKEHKLYDVADNIGCMSEGNRRYIAEHNNVQFEKLSIFPNTKKINSLQSKDMSIREKYKISQDKVVFVFGGNMGKPQGMEFLVNAIKKSNEIREAFFVLVGRGTEIGKVKAYLEECENVLILDNLSRDEYEKLIASCDVGIVSLDYRFTIPNYPSRILSYMEYGLPVLAVTDRYTDFRDLIEYAGCGYWCESNAIDNFIKVIKKFCSDVDRTLMGLKGRIYMEKHFDVKESVILLEEYMVNNMKDL